MMLIDKGYFDFDFEQVEKELRWETTVRTKEELQGMLARFGLGGATKKKAPQSLEEIQEHILKQI